LSRSANTNRMLPPSGVWDENRATWAWERLEKSPRPAGDRGMNKPPTLVTRVFRSMTRPCRADGRTRVGRRVNAEHVELRDARGRARDQRRAGVRAVNL